MLRAPVTPDIKHDPKTYTVHICAFKLGTILSFIPFSVSNSHNSHSAFSEDVNDHVHLHNCTNAHQYLVCDPPSSRQLGHVEARTNMHYFLYPLPQSLETFYISSLMKQLFWLCDPEINMVNSINLQNAWQQKVAGSVKNLINEQQLKLLTLPHASNSCHKVTKSFDLNSTACYIATLNLTAYITWMIFIFNY